MDTKPLNDNYLHPGDIVHIIAPSCKGNDKYLDAIKEYVLSLNLIPYIENGIYDDSELFYSNTDEFRAEDLISALQDDSKLVWCIRGGSGAARLLPYLEQALPNDLHQKLFVGYSDITALHIYLHNKYNWSTIQGAMLEQIVTGKYRDEHGNDSSSVTELLDLIFGNISSIKLPNLKPINSVLLEDITGKIVGGNLTLVENSIGTNWQIDATNKIIFFEDTNEHAYALEKSLDHMKAAHIFDGVLAVIFGDFTNYDDQNIVSFVEERFANSVDFPVFTIEGIGHGFENHPLPLNTEATIFSNKNGEYSLQVNNIWI